MTKKVVKFKIDDEDWESFVKKYSKGSRYSKKGEISKRLNQLMRMDLEGKIPDSETTLTPYRKKFEKKILVEGQTN